MFAGLVARLASLAVLAVALSDAGALAEPLAIRVKRRAGEKYERIVGYQLGTKPPRLESNGRPPETVAAYGVKEDDIPF